MLREMENHKRHYQIRCSHHEVELMDEGKIITCTICGKQWHFIEDRGYLKSRRVFAAEKDD